MSVLITFLQNKVLDAQTLNDSMAEEKNKYAKLLEEERKTSLQNKARVTLIFCASCYNINCRLRFMMRNGFFNRSRNWRSQMRSCSSAEKRPRKLLLRYKSLQNLLYIARLHGDHFSFSLQLYLFSTDYCPPGWGQDSGRCQKRSTQMS